MADVVFVLLLVLLFVATAGVIEVCDRLVGGDEALTSVRPSPAADPEPETAAA